MFFFFFLVFSRVLGYYSYTIIGFSCSLSKVYIRDKVPLWERPDAWQSKGLDVGTQATSVDWLVKLPGRARHAQRGSVG